MTSGGQTVGDMRLDLIFDFLEDKKTRNFAFDNFFLFLKTTAWEASEKCRVNFPPPPPPDRMPPTKDAVRLGLNENEAVKSKTL